MSEETRKSVEAFAPLLTREELMELSTESLVEKVIGLRGDIEEDAEEMVYLRDALARAERSLDTTRDIAARLRDELAQAKYERTQALAMAVDTAKLMRLRCPKSDGPMWPWRDCPRSPRDAFERLWTEVYGPGAWAANPWVWRVEGGR